MNLTTVTLGELVDRALDGLQAAPELGRRVLRASAIEQTTETSLQIDDATKLNVTDLLEFADELMFVSAKSDAMATATLTVVRGYANTVAQTHAANQVGSINPLWNRKRVAREIVDAFCWLEGNRLPLVITSTTIAPDVDPFDPGIVTLEVPVEARGVYLVRWGLYDVPNWEYIEDLPLELYPTGKVVRLPRALRRANEDFSLVYRLPYRWSVDPPTEASTIRMVEGSEEVPVTYAVWQLCSARETSRHQIDRSEEWTSGQYDTGPTLVRLKREEFYGALDAARRLNPPPRRRPLVSYPTLTGLRWVPT